GQHGVRMRQEQEPRPVASTGNPRHEIRPPRNACVQPAFDTERLQVVAEKLGRRGLVAGRVDRVEADQLLEEVRDLLAQRLRGHYLRRPRMSRYGPGRTISSPTRSSSYMATAARWNSSRRSGSSDS